MTTLNKYQIIGIGGLPRSGKDTLAELFIDNGYYGVSFGDIVRGFATQRHKNDANPISVANMTETSNWLRETRGPDVILNEAMRQFKKASETKKYKGVVLFSVRAPVEVDFILNHSGEVIWVESSDEIRHQRWLEHQRKGEAALSLSEFKKEEALQWKPQPGTPVEAQMNVAYVKEHATKTFINNQNDLNIFNKKAKELLIELD